MSPNTIPVLLVTDAPLVRDGLLQTLASETTISIVGTAATCGEVVAAVGGGALSPQVVLLDMRTARCVEIGRTLRAAAPGVFLVAFCVDLNHEDQLVCIEAGITGFVRRQDGLRELVNAVAAVARGEGVCSPGAIGAAFRRVAQLSTSRSVSADGHPALTEREAQIVSLIARGLSNKDIARRLQVSLATVKNHVHSILEKWQVRGRWEAAARFAASNGNTEPTGYT